MNTAYNILKEFCKIRNAKSSYGGLKNPITNRVNFINNYLDTNNISFVNRVFSINDFKECLLSSKDMKFCNIEISFNQNIDENRLIFISHHDVNYINSDNMNDNSASVCHLLSLANWLKNKKYPIDIIIVDNEEFGMSGSAYLAKQINMGKYGKNPSVVNLELTGFGEILHIEDQDDSILHKKIMSFKNDTVSWHVPANDSYRLRAYGVDSICLGILPQDEIDYRNKHGFAKCWSKMHSNLDKFEDANDNDMKNFNLLLRRFSEKYVKDEIDI